MLFLVPVITLVLAAWGSVATLVAAIRFRSWPLLMLTSSLISYAPFWLVWFLSETHLSAPFYLLLALALGMYGIFRFRYGGWLALTHQGIRTPDVLLFKPKSQAIGKQQK